MSNVFKTLTTILVLMCSFIANAAWTVRYQHTDTLGSVIAESNSQGTITQRFDYKPFGEGTPTQKAGVGYTGHLEDTDLGLTYMQQRYYDPVIGRFYSNDPVGFSADSPMMFNRYAYANNNPYKYIDPDGRNSYNPQGMAATLQPLSTAQKIAGVRMIANASPAGRGAQVAKIIVGAVLNEAASSGDKDASTPTGSRDNPMEVEPGTNEPTEIEGREYSGHALDRMQGRGIPPSAVEESIKNGDAAPGNRPGTTTHTDSANGVKSVTNETGKVVTVITVEKDK